MVDRNKKALADKQAKEETKEIEKKYSEKREIRRIQHKMIVALTNGRYWLERCNMMAEQVDAGNIMETVDGVTKSKGYIMAEYASFKVMAIDHMRESHFSRQDLLSRGVTAEEIDAHVAEYYEGKIMKEVWDEDDRRTVSPAEFAPYDGKNDKK